MNDRLVGHPKSGRWVRDAARDCWVEVSAGPSMTVAMPKHTKQPIGFVIPEPEPSKPVAHLAGGWAKR